jgi:hypothetical protein
MQIRHAGGHIVVRINELNPSAVGRFCTSLDDENHQNFESFLRTYVPLPQATVSPPDVPQFDLKNAASFRRKVLDVSHRADAAEWFRIRAPLYDEINRSLLCENCDKASFQLVTKLFAEKGNTEYHRLLPGLLSQSNGPWKQFVDNIFVTLLNDVDRAELLAAMSQCVLSEKVSVAQAGIELITRILATVRQEEVIGLFSGVFEPLSQAIQNDAPEVRKACVLCFVEMKVVSGTAADEFIGRLARTHQKLVAVYYQRRIGG